MLLQEKAASLAGRKLREVRHARGLSIQHVADRAQISVATLSRIETNKQGLDLSLFLLLARILHSMPADLLESGDGGSASEQVAERIAGLDCAERTCLWRRLTVDSRAKRARSRSAAVTHLAARVDELLAELDFLRAEIESVAKQKK